MSKTIDPKELKVRIQRDADFALNLMMGSFIAWAFTAMAIFFIGGRTIEMCGLYLLGVMSMAFYHGHYRLHQATEQLEEWFELYHKPTNPTFPPIPNQPI